jgi:hypothetical protein
MMRADLHVHSRHSTRPSQWFLQKIGCPESFTDPLQLYHIARRRGMTLVTITDHNKIDGALEIAHLPGAFVSEEVTAYFPEDGCKIHVLVYRITEAQHAEIQKIRIDIYDLVRYLKEAAIPCALAHPMYAVNDRLTVAHIEKLLLLFRNFELNGDSNPEANRSLEAILSALTPADIERLANTHGISPLWPEPWRKNLIGGSDDHSSLNISRSFTQVEGAAGIDDFLSGIESGEARVIQRPSSPQAMAHNLYSIAYQFYRQKLGLSREVPQHFLLRFVDRSLRLTDGAESGFMARLHFLWQYRRIRKIQGSIPGPLVELLQQETSRLLHEDPALFDLPDGGNFISKRMEERWFSFMDRMSNRILLGCANHLLGHVSGANLFNIFQTIGSAGGFCTLLTPYAMAFSIYNRQRQFSQAVLERFGHNGHHERLLSQACAVFADAHADGIASIRTHALGYPQQGAMLLTCEAGAAESEAVKRFAPIGIYEFNELPHFRMVYPPVLEMLDYCYAGRFSRVHLATAGPSGLAGLFIARFLRLPLTADFSDLLPCMAREITRDGFIEELCWRYTLWFYSQMDAVYVSSDAQLAELVQRGIPRAKLRVAPQPALSEHLRGDARISPAGIITPRPPERLRRQVGARA